MTDWLQWAAIIALFLFVCFARGSAVNQARRELRAYDDRLGEAAETWAANEVSAHVGRSLADCATPNPSGRASRRRTR